MNIEEELAKYLASELVKTGNLEVISRTTPFPEMVHDISIIVEKYQMKLFVWTDVLTDYDSGLAVVFAHDEEEARNIMKEKFPNYITEQLPFASCKVITNPDAYYTYGSS